jgi:hypothetical protein
VREEHAILIWPDEREDYAHLLASLHAALDEAAFGVAWTAGRAFSWEQAVAEALVE